MYNYAYSIVTFYYLQRRDCEKIYNALVLCGSENQNLAVLQRQRNEDPLSGWQVLG